MRAVILAGGLGTRISEETGSKPKPMIEIGGKPLLWHLMKIYSHHGINDFVLCLGFKGYVIKEYFANYFLHMSDVTIDMETNEVEVHHQHVEPWKITLVDTGELTSTGGRLKRVAQHIAKEENVCFTYGDGLSNVDISGLVAKHVESGLLSTVTAVKPPGRYGSLKIVEDVVTSFDEKPPGDGGWINGGFFVVSTRVLEEIEGDNTSWEIDTLPQLAQRGQLGVFYHSGFWQPMDTLRDKVSLENLWASGSPPWRTWNWLP